MTNKRYSKFKSEISGLFCIADENHKETFCGMDNEYNCMRIVNILNQKEERINKLEKENKELKMTEKYYVVRYYQENGFASTDYIIKTFKDLKKAKFYAKFMNKEDKDAMYFVYEKEFDDDDMQITEVQYCRNCKHLSTDGMFGLICDVCGDNRKYNCPKYEKKVI